MSTSHIGWVREHKGLEAAFNEACDAVRKNETELETLWQTRFFERRVLEGGSKKLFPCTEAGISSAYDLQDLDGAPLPEYLYCDDDGELYPVTVGAQHRMGSDPEGPDEVPFVYASSAMVANGKAVALVLHAYKNRWGQVDAVVAFEDASLNADSSYMAPIHAEDRAGLERRAKRSVMPVLTGRGGANYSADRGVAQAQHADARVTSTFIRASLKGHAAEADLLLAAGARRSVWSDLRKLQIAAREADE